MQNFSNFTLKSYKLFNTANQKGGKIYLKEAGNSTKINYNKTIWINQYTAKVEYANNG